MTQNILTSLINIAAPLIGIALVIFCIIQGFKMVRGSEGASMGKLLGGVAGIIIIGSIMFAAGSFTTWGQALGDSFGSLFGNAAGESSQLTGGGGKK